MKRNCTANINDIKTIESHYTEECHAEAAEEAMAMYEDSIPQSAFIFTLTDPADENGNFRFSFGWERLRRDNRRTDTPSFTITSEQNGWQILDRESVIQSIVEMAKNETGDDDLGFFANC